MSKDNTKEKDQLFHQQAIDVLLEKPTCAIALFVMARDGQVAGHVTGNPVRLIRAIMQLAIADESVKAILLSCTAMLKGNREIVELFMQEVENLKPLEK